jgi:uncharacterized protein
MNQSSVLYRLQQIDSQLDHAKNRLHEVEVALNENTALINAQQMVTSANADLSVELKKLRNAEEAVKDVRIKIEQTESTLYGGKVHNPKELQDLQNEAAALKRRLTDLEDRQLESMLSSEDAEITVKSAINKMNDINSQIIEQNAQLSAEKTQLLNQIDRLEAERKAALAPIQNNDLILYEQLRKMRNGVAVVKVSAKACTACGTTLTAALIQSTQSPGQLVRCPTCGRILYPG